MNLDTKVFLMLSCIYFNAIQCEKYQRLILPSSVSLLKIIPRVEVPTAASASIQSGLSLKMPISITLPSMMDVVKSMRQSTSQTEMNVLSANKTRVTSRSKFYKSIEKTHPSFGRICLMRAICEVAEVPFMSASTGLLGEIIDLLLT